MPKFLTMLAMCIHLLSVPAIAEPLPYDVDQERSTVSFSYTLEGAKIAGSFPDFSSKLVLDFDRVSNSIVDVAINTLTVKGGIVFATDALRGPEILDVVNYPTIRFRSAKIDTVGQSVRIRGNITIKDVTRPITLVAKLFRAPTTQSDERDNLTIKISGQINRNEFDVRGYKSLVGAIIKIDVTAKIRRRQS